MATDYLYAVLPYLKTSKRGRVRGIEFRRNDDLSDLKPDVQKALSQLCQLFFLHTDWRIEQMTCAVLEIPTDRHDYSKLVQRLHEFHLLIGYLYSHPHVAGDVFLPYESSSLFVFRKGDLLSQHVGSVLNVWHGQHFGNRVKYIGGRQIPDDMWLPGYLCWRNETVQFSVVEDSRIFPETHNIVLNHSQDLFYNIMELLEHPYNWGLALLYGYAHDLPEQIHDRVFISLDWYMRSCRAGIVETESLVNLAIALESLLRITQEKSERITERFRDAILTLLGPVPLLDSWIVQFYDARSEAVHKGEASDLQFYPSGKAVPKTQESKQKQSEPPVPHRSLLDYGRRVFRLCLATVIAGAQHTHMTGLGAMLIPNSDRFTTLCKILNSSEAPCKRIRDCSRLITELHEFSFNVKQPAFTQVIGAVKLILSAYKEALPLLFQKIESNVNQLNALPKDKMSEMDNCMEEIIRQLQGEMAHERDPLTTVVLGLLRYAVQPLFKLHDWNVRRSLGSEGPDSSD